MYTARLEALSLLTSTQEAKTGRERRPTYARRLSALLSSSPRITYPSYCRDTNSSFLPWWCRPIRELLSGNSGSTVRLSQTLRERGLLLAQSAPHGKTKAQTPNRNSSLSLQRLPPLRQKRTRKSQRA